MLDTSMTQDAGGRGGGLRDAGLVRTLSVRLLRRGCARGLGPTGDPLVPFPSSALAGAVKGAKVVAVYENNTGQMVDDVRLAVLGAAPVEFIGGVSLGQLGFRHCSRSRCGRAATSDPRGGGPAPMKEHEARLLSQPRRPPLHLPGWSRTSPPTSSTSARIICVRGAGSRSPSAV